MKKILLSSLCIIALCFSSCGTTVHKLTADCNVDNKVLFSKITAILLQENFMLKSQDIETGYLQAETVPEFSVWTGMSETRYWIFHVRNNNAVTAQAKVVYSKTNAFGAATGGTTKYYNDDVHKDWTWYWNVRNELESVCKNKIIFLESKIN